MEIRITIFNIFDCHGFFFFKSKIEIHQKKVITVLPFRDRFLEAPGWPKWLSVQLWLRSRSQGPWVRAPCQALCWHLRAWSLLPILCLPLSLCPPLKNKYIFKTNKQTNKQTLFLLNSCGLREGCRNRTEFPYILWSVCLELISCITIVQVLKLQKFTVYNAIH